MSAGETTHGSGVGERLATALPGVGLFLLVVALTMLPLCAGTPRLSVRLLALAVGMAGAVLWTLQMIFYRRLDVPWGGPVFCGAAALVAAVASGVGADCPGAAIETVLTWLGYAAGFLLAFWVGSDEPVRARVVRALCALAVPVAMLGVLQYAFILDRVRRQIEANPRAALVEVSGTERDYEALLNRVRHKRVFSTFALPNSLGAFLLLAIPPATALILAARRRGPQLVLAGCAGLFLVGLFLTFSKGAWLAGLVVLLVSGVFAVWRGRAGLRRRWRSYGVGMAAAAVVLGAAVAAMPGLRERLGRMPAELADTATVRLGYWSAALSMWRARPVLGVGPGNFKNHYPRYKWPIGEETKNAHNDYVQLLAECGPVAVAGYIGFWGLLLVGSIRRRRPGEVEADSGAGPRHRAWWETSGMVVVAAGLVGIVGAAVLEGVLFPTDDPWINTVVFALFPALWLVGYAAGRGTAEDASSRRLLEAGLALGLLGFVLHSVVDLDLYVEGVAYVAFVLAGLSAAPWLRRRALRVGGTLQAIVLLAAVLLGVGVLWAMTRVSQAASYRAHGQALLKRFLLETDDPLGRRADLAAARAAFETACRLNPFDHQAFARAGDAALRQFAIGRDPADLDQSIVAWRRAVALNPAHAEYHKQLARLFAEAVRRSPRQVERYVKEYEASAGGAVPSPAPPRRGFLPALVEAYRAVERAPAKPEYGIVYGDVLALAGFRDRALSEYQRAYRLHRDLVKWRGPRRQRLSPRQVQELLRKIRKAEGDAGDGT